MSEAIFAWNFTLISLYAKQPISCCLSAMFSVNSRDMAAISIKKYVTTYLVMDGGTDYKTT